MSERRGNGVNVPVGTASTHGTNGNDSDRRLRAIEERLIKIETRFDTELGHLATKEDISDLRALIERKDATHLRWLLGILATTAIALVITLVRTLTG